MRWLLFGYNWRRVKLEADGMETMFEIDWKQAPKNAQWWAIDENGEAHWFCSPNVKPFTRFWFSEPQPAPAFGYTGDWRESLHSRP